MGRPQKIFVLGGGLIGLSVGNYLLHDGHDVTVVDCDEPGNGASFGNAGVIANYAILPMANSETVRNLPRMLLTRNSGISVRPLYWGNMLGFGRAFLSAATEASFTRNLSGLTSLIQDACTEFPRLLRRCKAEDLVENRGCLLVYRQPEVWRHVRDEQTPLRRASGIQCETVSAEQILELEPSVKGARMVGGIFYPDARHVLNPNALCQHLLRHFIAAGGKFERALVREVIQEQTGSVHIRTEAGTGFSADKAILALGARTRTMLQSFGYRLPLVSERGYHLMIKPPRVAPTRPIGWGDHHFFLTPMASGLRVAGTTEFASPGAHPANRRFTLLISWAEELLGEPVTVESRWVGSRASTPDGLPLIGPLRDHKSILIATGHGHVGVTMSALTARMISEMLLGRESNAATQMVSPERFRG